MLSVSKNENQSILRLFQNINIKIITLGMVERRQLIENTEFEVPNKASIS